MVSFRPSTLTSATTRLAPYCASAMLAARPSPLPPPTTTTLRPSSRNSDVKSIESDIFFFLPTSRFVRSVRWRCPQDFYDGGVVGASEAGAATGEAELLGRGG